MSQDAYVAVGGGATEWGATGKTAAASFCSAKVMAVSAIVLVGTAIGLGVGLGLPQGGSGPSSSGPEQIMLAAASNGVDANHAMHVTWVIPYGSSFSGVPPRPSLSPAPPVVNGGVVPNNPRVQWGFSPSQLSFEAPAAVSSYSYTTAASNYSSPVLLNATIGCAASSLSAGTGNAAAPACQGELTPGAPFWYRVGDDANGWSGTAMSYALPPAGTPNVRLAVIGDLGTTGNSSDTLDHILANHASPVPMPDGTPGPAAGFSAVLHVGDLSYADGTQGVWDTYGRMLQKASSIIPWMYGPGNHEWFDFASYSFTSYLARFRTPAAPGNANALYYSFEVGQMHVVMLQGYCPQMSSTSTQPCLAAGSAQLAWLLADLAAVDRNKTPWVIATFHQPYMNSNTAHAISSEGMPMKQAIDDVLYAHKVDVVFSGHVHAYERCCRAYNYTCVPDGPLFITIGDAGNREGLADEWVDPQPAWSVFRQASYGHGEFTAVNSTHLLWQWHQNPDLAPVIADSYWLVKGQQGEVGPGVTSRPVYAADRAAAKAAALGGLRGH